MCTSDEGSTKRTTRTMILPNHTSNIALALLLLRRREMLEILNSPMMSKGYYETILEWLRTRVLDPDKR